MRRCVVLKLLDLGKTVESGLNDAPLHASAPSVNHANFAKARTGGRLDVSLNNRRDVARRERMQIEVILNRHAMQIVHRPFPCRTTLSPSF